MRPHLDASNALVEDMERLGDIGDCVLAGEPLDSFSLTKWERLFVVGYVHHAMGEAEDA